MIYHLPPVEDRALWDIWLSSYRLPTVAVADEMGIFEALRDGPATAEELANRRQLNLRGLAATLSMLAALELVTVSGDRFELSGAARTYLLPDSAYYWGPMLRTFGIIPHLHVALKQALTGAPPTVEPPPRAIGGGADAALERPALPEWEKGEITPEFAARVSRLMHCHSLPAASALARDPSFGELQRLLDVGGGSGCFSVAFAQRVPHLRCTVMDLAGVCEVARDYITEGEVVDRVDTISVDMLRDEWPRGYDAIFLSNVFHDWARDTNAQLARAAHAALPSGGRILLHEMLMNEDGVGPATTAAFSLVMLTGARGKQYSLAELTEILESAGFVDVRVKPAYGYYSLVSATRP